MLGTQRAVLANCGQNPQRWTMLDLQVNSGLSLPIDEVAPGDVDSNGEPIDAKLYTTFWGLQNVFKVRGKCSANLGGGGAAECVQAKEQCLHIFLCTLRTIAGIFTENMGKRKI
eukprot:1149164-Pelagomonas_calceolata.AAC.3